MTSLAHKIPPPPHSFAELHLHLTGSYPLPYLQSIATPEQFHQLEQAIEIVKKSVPYSQVFRYFQPIESIVNTESHVYHGCLALCADLAKQRIVYVEIRTGLKDLGSGYEGYLRCILSALSTQNDVMARVLLSLRRNTTKEVAERTVDLAIKYAGQGVVGIDISGDSTLEGIFDLAIQVQRAKKHGLKLALHIGESFDEICTVGKQKEQAQILELLQPARLGHAVHLSKESKQWLVQHPFVPIEICPSSSVLAQMLAQDSDHPGLDEYLQRKHPIVISMDDPLLMGTNLDKEFEIVLNSKLVDSFDIHQFVEWSFQFAFASKTDMKNLRIHQKKSALL